jgi:hypothetical protein
MKMRIAKVIASLVGLYLILWGATFCFAPDRAIASVSEARRLPINSKSALFPQLYTDIAPPCVYVYSWSPCPFIIGIRYQIHGIILYDPHEFYSLWVFGYLKTFKA